MTSIRFNTPELEGIENELGGLKDTLISVANDRAFNTFGKTALLNPSDIEITPAVIDEPVFILRAWHETGGQGNAGVLQKHDLSFKLASVKENVFISTEDKKLYLLTTRETLLLTRIGGFTIIKSFLSAPPNFED